MVPPSIKLMSTPSELYKKTLQIIPFGTKAKRVLDEQHISYVSSIEDNGSNTLVLIVTDDAASYEAEIMQVLSAVGIGHFVYLVLDLNESSDTEKYRTIWTHYNKVTDGLTVKDVHQLIQNHITRTSLIAFDNHDLLTTCSQGEYIGSICIENGLDGLKEVNAPTNAKSVAVGLSFADPSNVMMEQMNEVNDFFQKFAEGTVIKWSITSAPKDEGIIVYSYNK